MDVRIVTYNLLVPIFAEQPDYYRHCQPEFLETDYRWKLIQSQLEEEIRSNQNTIICLQEVSRTMMPMLKSFFHRLSYTLFDRLYGDRRNDFMGVGLAIPKSMRVTSENSINVGDYLRSLFQSRQKSSMFNAWWNHLKDAFVGRSDTSQNDTWEIAMSTSNMLLCVGVLIHGRHLVIGTYHMPCRFDMSGVMVMHASAVKDLMFQLADGHPFVLAGDFNTKPHDIAYRVITKRDFAQNLALPEGGYNKGSSVFKTHQLLRSAYREKNGTEPNYTNFAATRQSPTFCATLDYIFLNGRLGVDHVLRLPDHPTGISYPDRTHPSDHLMIAATLRLP